MTAATQPAAKPGDKSNTTRLSRLTSQLKRLLAERKARLKDDLEVYAIERNVDMLLREIPTLPNGLDLDDEDSAFLMEATDALRVEAREASDPEGLFNERLATVCGQTQITLSASQTVALRTLYLGLTAKQPVYRTWALSGYAGTGKTTILRLLLRLLYLAHMPVILAAPTGKAASRMAEVLAEEITATYTETPRTLHSLLYGPPVLQGKCPACNEWSEEVRNGREDDETNRSCPKCHRTPTCSPREMGTRMSFGKPRLRVDSRVVLIVDEASMVGESQGSDIARTVLGNGLVLYTGDNGQIPPVGDKPAVNLGLAQAQLTEIHRQVEGHPIIKLAAALRTPVARMPWDTMPLADGDRLTVNRPMKNGGVTIGAMWLFEKLKRSEDATLLAASNKTRQAANAAVRKLAGLYPAGTPFSDGSRAPSLVPGEKVLILLNNHTRGLMNGEVFRVSEVEPGAETPYTRALGVPEIRIRLADRPGALFAVWPDLMDDSQEGTTTEYQHRVKAAGRIYNHHFEAWQRAVGDTSDHPAYAAWVHGDVAGMASIFEEECGFTPPGSYLHLTWGYCLTIHKSQGSQWDNVGLIVDWAFYSMVKRGEGHKLAYTAVTRAAKRLFIIAEKS